MMWPFHFLYVTCAETGSSQEKREEMRDLFFELLEQSSKSCCGLEAWIKVTDTRLLASWKKVHVAWKKGVWELTFEDVWGYFHIRFSFCLTHTTHHRAEHSSGVNSYEWELQGSASAHGLFFFSFFSQGQTEESDSHVFTTHNVI